MYGAKEYTPEETEKWFRQSLRKRTLSQLVADLNSMNEQIEFFLDRAVMICEAIEEKDKQAISKPS